MLGHNLDVGQISEDLDEQGYVIIKGLIDPQDCRALSESYSGDAPFRSRVVMARHGFGQGEYKYFSYPLPDLVTSLRTRLYHPLAGIANRWNETMKLDQRFPSSHAQYLKDCHDAGQVKPTPLLLHFL